MQLSDSLRAMPGQALAFVGAGGKTSAITRLVDELAPAIPVLVTTTTRLGSGQQTIAAWHVLDADPGWREAMGEHLAGGQSVLLTGPADEDGKWTAPADAALDAARDLVDRLGGVILVEADGARSLSLKAPASHEPVVPAFSSQTVLLAGLDVIGKPLSMESVHRPELAAPVMGLKQGEEISVEHAARLLASPLGGLKGIPGGSRLCCLLNRASAGAGQEAGDRLAALLMREPRFASVLLGELHAREPVRKVYGRTGCVVLAAGGSKRFGRQKLLEPWRGEPMIRHAARAALQARSAPVVVVTGAESVQLVDALSGLPLEFVHNADWESGQSSSLRLGLAAVASRVDAVCFLLGDMPLVEQELVEALIAEHRRTLAPVIAPAHAGRPGNPVLFDRVTFEALDAVRGDQGGRAVFDRFPPRLVEWGASASADIDSVEDLRRLGHDQGHPGA